jgi:hypothetical protein
MIRMKTLLLITLSGFSFLCHAQGLDKGAFSLNLAFDGGVHGTRYTSKYNGNSVGNPDTSAAATSLFRLNAHYSIFKWMSAGIDYRGGKYIEDPENAQAAGNKISMMAFALRFYPVNKDKFTWFVGTTIGTSRLEINRVYTFLVAIPARFKLNSPHLGLETGFNWYFSKNVGMNFGLGYSSHNFLLKEYYLNGNKQDISNYENRLETKGVHVNIGLSLRFNN